MRYRLQTSSQSWYWTLCNIYLIISICDFFSNKIEKEKKQLAKEAGMLKTEVTGPEVMFIHYTC